MRRRRPNAVASAQSTRLTARRSGCMPFVDARRRFVELHSVILRA
jgi:hypothetical protein